MFIQNNTKVRKTTIVNRKVKLKAFAFRKIYINHRCSEVQNILLKCVHENKEQTQKKRNKENNITNHINKELVNAYD